jgi:hypothetical protein
MVLTESQGVFRTGFCINTDGLRIFLDRDTSSQNTPHAFLIKITVQKLIPHLYSAFLLNSVLYVSYSYIQ